jgi:prephenate dehydratase
MILAPKRIAFQGELSAFSHQAANAVFPQAEVMPCPSFEDAFAAVQTGEADLGMIPIENSIAGRVGDVHHLLPTSGLNIIGEYFLPIRFQLMGVKGSSLATVKTARSHIMGLGQCRQIIRKLGLKPIVAADTAGSAREVAEMNDTSQAAIAPRLAAEIYGLDILAEDIEDAANNTTRFVILSRQKIWAAPGQNCLTSFVFQVRNVPAALYKAMGGFATNHVNMTKLESHMVDGRFVATRFYAEIEGHPDDRPVKLALEELDFFAKELTILGVYPQHPWRAEVEKQIAE